MKLEFLPQEFSVAKFGTLPPVPQSGIWFLAHTDKEISLVCESAYVPNGVIAIEDGWRAFRVVGQLEFSLIGILAGIAEALRRAEISIFCVSTYDTDYVLVKKDAFEKACYALRNAGYDI